eukprot:COSAG01_NODE_15623_length_1318_cov_2.561116_1_plen_288_part_01
MCSAGFYAASGVTACHPCHIGEADTDKNPATPCIACPKGKTSALNDTRCRIGSATGPQCDATFLGNNVGYQHVYHYKPATGDCKLDTKEVAVVCTKYYAECMKFLTQKTHPTCDPIFLGPDVGYATVFTYHDKDGSCRLNMKELQKLCKTHYQECVSFLKSSQKPKCDPIDLGPGIGKQKVLQWYDDTANCLVNMREIKKVCKSKFQQCLAFIDKKTPTCDAVFLGANIGFANIFEYHDSDGTCKIDINELESVCNQHYAECLSFLASSKPKCERVFRGPDVGWAIIM